MSTSSSTLETRIARLERLNRVLVTVAASVLLLLIAAAAGTTGTTIRATAFHLVDADGVVRAELAFRDGSPGLFLKDNAGVDRLAAVHDPDGTGLSINDGSGTTRIGVVQFAHGGGGVALHGAESKGAAVLYFKNEGSLRFFDHEGEITNEITASPPRDGSRSPN